MEVLVLEFPRFSTTPSTLYYCTIRQVSSPGFLACQAFCRFGSWTISRELVFAVVGGISLSALVL